MLSSLHTASESLIAAIALPVVRAWFDYPITFTQWVWDRCFLHTSHDGRSLWDQVQRTTLGDGTISVQVPLDENGRPRKEVKGFIIYVPGGGFAATAFYQYSSSTTPFVRRGFVAIGIDYAKSSAMSATASAPGKVREIVQKVLEHGVPAFPDMLRLGVHVMGDSAGANLALMTGLALSNHKVRRALGLGEFSVPPVHSVVGISGMMARTSDLTKADAATIPFVIRHALGFLWRAHLGELALPRLLGFVEGAGGGGGGGGGEGAASSLKMLKRALAKGAFASLLGEVRERKLDLDFPPVLLCCGSADFLVTHSKLVKRLMDELGLSCDYEEYADAPHAFYAIPCEWTFGCEFLGKRVQRRAGTPAAALLPMRCDAMGCDGSRRDPARENLCSLEPSVCYRSSVPCARDILCFLMDRQPGAGVDMGPHEEAEKGVASDEARSRSKESRVVAGGKRRRSKSKGKSGGTGDNGNENDTKKIKENKKMPLSEFVTGKRDMPMTAPTAWIVASEIVLLMPATIVLSIVAFALIATFVIKGSIDLAINLAINLAIAVAAVFIIRGLIAPIKT